MKTKLYYLYLLGCILLLSSCEFDNYDAPTISLSGQLWDGNVPLQTKRGIAFKLYQYREDGYISAGSKAFNIHVDQEGKFSSLLFSGRYKMVVNTNDGGQEDSEIYTAHTWQGDFQPINPETGILDTIYFDISKNMTMDFQVSPYYKFNDFQAVYEDGSIVARFSITKLVDSEATTDRLRKVNLFMSPTMHINRDTKLFFTLPARDLVVDTPIEFKCSLQKYYSDDNYVNNYRDYVYLRLGAAKQNAVNVYNYSPVIKVSGIPQEVIKKLKE